MTKQDLVSAMASHAGITKKASGDALESLIASVTASLKKGGKVTITGFGTFRASKRSARMGVNPRNPQKRIEIAARNVPTFRAGKSFKDALN